MWPVTRSTSNHGPRCHTQLLPAGAGFTLGLSLSPGLSAGRLSLSLITRLTTKLRSVTSWASPVVHSFRTPSTSRARTFSSFSAWAAPAGSPALEYGTFRAAPSTTTCALRGAAKECEAQIKDVGRTEITKTFLPIMHLIQLGSIFQRSVNIVFQDEHAHQKELSQIGRASC